MKRSCFACGLVDQGLLANNGVSFHQLPSIGSRRDSWLKSLESVCILGEKRLPTDLRICSQHFSHSSFQLTPCGKKRLRLDAIPDFSGNTVVNTSCNLSTCADEIGSTKSTSIIAMDLAADPTTSAHGTHCSCATNGRSVNETELLHQVQELKKRLRASQKHVSKLRITVQSLRKQLKAPTSIVQSCGSSGSCDQSTLGLMSGGRTYTEAQKIFAKSVYREGRAAIRTMRQHFKMPSDRTIQRWRSADPAKTGGASNECKETKSKKAQQKQPQEQHHPEVGPSYRISLTID